jgi:hypothetical protein
MRLARVDPDDDLADVVGRMTPASPFLTVWRDGRLVGIVPADTLQRRLRAALAGPA